MTDAEPNAVVRPEYNEYWRPCPSCEGKTKVIHEFCAWCGTELPWWEDYPREGPNGE